MEQTNNFPNSLGTTVIVTALIVVFVILFAMCGSWFEPILFLLVIGSAVALNMGTNIFKAFKKELLMMTLLTAASIFVIILLTFRKIFVPVILVLLVQSAVFITASVSFLQGYDINYLAYVIVQCILMGATTAVVLIMFILPGLLSVMDRLIVKKNRHK